MSKRITGWLLDPGDRERLLASVAPAYADVVAHHVTLKVGTRAPPPADTNGEAIGVADDGQGVQALVVRIGGATDRPGGGTYHITWSLDRAKGRRPVESNEVIARCGWTPLPAPEPVALPAPPSSPDPSAWLQPLQDRGEGSRLRARRAPRTASVSRPRG